MTGPSKWDDEYRDGGGRLWPCDELVRFLGMRGAPGTLGGRVLEVGCGLGNNAWALCEWGYRVAGADWSLPGLRLASNYVGLRLAPAVDNVCRAFSPVCAAAPALPFAAASFDGVVDSMLSQHLDPAARRAFYAEARRVLRTGGWLFVYHLSAFDAALFPRYSDETWPMGAEGLRQAVMHAGFVPQQGHRTKRLTYDDARVAEYVTIVASAA